MTRFISEETVKEVLFLSRFKDHEKEALLERVVQLRDKKGLSFAKIAEETGMSKGNANKIYNKANDGKSNK